MFPCSVSISGLSPSRREFFSGRPAWKTDSGLSYRHPGGFERYLDPESGAFYWVDGAETVWDTEKFWELQAELAEQEIAWQQEAEQGGLFDQGELAGEDIYGLE